MWSLSGESSVCRRDSYAGVDLDNLLGGMAPGPGYDVAAQLATARAMVTVMVSISCLNQEEFAMAGQVIGIAPGECEGFQCVLGEAGKWEAGQWGRGRGLSSGIWRLTTSFRSRAGGRTTSRICNCCARIATG